MVRFYCIRDLMGGHYGEVLLYEHDKVMLYSPVTMVIIVSSYI